MGFPLVNFLAGLRKPALIPFNYFSPGDSISWIESIPGGVTSINGLTGAVEIIAGSGITINTSSPNIQVVGNPLTLSSLTGTINGVNLVFTVPAFMANCLIFKNGVLQTSPLMYTISGTTVTFTYAFTPQPGDNLQCLTN
jgi:hypothetical protein